MKLHRMRFRLGLALLVSVVALALLSAQAVTVASVTPAQTAPPTSKLIVGINTQRFFKILGAQPMASSLGGSTITYSVLPWKQGRQGERTKIDSGVEISVLPSVEIAHQNFAARLNRPVAPARTGGMGDEFYCWHNETYSAGLSYDAAQGNCLLRRSNVVISFGYQGSLRAMLEVAQRVDTALANADAVAPRGAQFTFPEVQLTVPPRISVGELFRIDLSSPPNIPVRVGEAGESGDGYHAILVTTKKLYRTAPSQPGPFEIAIPLMTAENVAFVKKITVQIVPDFALGAPQVHAWPLQFDTFLFKPDVKIAERQIPMEKHEWMNTVPGDQGVFRRDDEAKLRQQALQEQALQEWSAYVKPEWLPSWPMLEVGPEFEPPAPPKYNARCSVTRGRTKLVFMGVIGKSLWLYLEQPLPLPSGSVPLNATAIIRPEPLQSLFAPHRNSINLHCPDVYSSYGGPTRPLQPQGEIAQQTFERYRSFLVPGPYNHVRILMIRLDFPKASK